MSTIDFAESYSFLLISHVALWIKSEIRLYVN